MMPIEDIVSKLELHKDKIKRQYKISKIGVFNGIPDSEVSEEIGVSDSNYVDILVEFKGAIGLEFVDLSTELEILLGEKVHLISKSGINARYLKKVKHEIIYL